MERKRPKNEADLQQAYRTSYLIAGFIRSTLTEEEREELDEWILADRSNMALFGELTNEGNVEKALADFDRMQTELGLQQVKRKPAFQKKKRPFPLQQLMMAAAVTIAVLMTIVLVKILINGNQPQKVVAKKSDISPATEWAVLKLSSGELVPLQPGVDTLIESGAHVSANGEVNYALAEARMPPAYHIITVPRKAHYKLVLADGTIVWLNAASSIRFPTRFTGDERKVEVTGETYFEVAHNADMPFRVAVNGLEVEARGTAFNISAYDNEPSISTTLIEGSVLVKSSHGDVRLTAGEQAIWQDNQLKKAAVDSDMVIAWRNNEFKFRNTSLGVIMRQVERWYDAEVIFKEPVDLHLNATIERDVPVSRLLQLLQATNQVKFSVEGKKIVVSK